MSNVLAEKNIGPHFLTREEPDLFVARFHGDLDAAQMLDLLQALREHFVGLKYFLILIDHTHIGAISPEARRAVREKTKGELPFAMALIGASFTTRVIADLVIRTLNLVRREPVHYRVFKDEASARAWLREMRGVLTRSSA